MAKHRLTADQAAAEKTVAMLDTKFKAKGIDQQFRAQMTPAQREDLDRILREHSRRTGR